MRRVLVWVGSQLAANTLLLWNALHLANAPCPSSDRHTIHGHEAYLGEEKIEWSFMLQVIDFYATRESQHVKCFQMASNKTVFAEENEQTWPMPPPSKPKLVKLSFLSKEKWHRKNYVRAPPRQPLRHSSYICSFLAISKCSCKSQTVQLQCTWPLISKQEFVPSTTKGSSKRYVEFWWP